MDRDDAGSATIQVHQTAADIPIPTTPERARSEPAKRSRSELPGPPQVQFKRMRELKFEEDKDRLLRIARAGDTQATFDAILQQLLSTMEAVKNA